MYIAIDIGGTKTLVVLYDENKQVLSEVKFETPKDYSLFINELHKAKDQLTDQGPFKAGAIGCRGVIDRKLKTLVYDDKLGWQNANIGEIAENVFGCEFSIENDAKLAGLSEAHLHEDKSIKFLYITVSTGINSAYVVNGVLDSNTVDSEIGKWIFEHQGQLKLWENFASGSYLTETYGKRASELDDDDAWRDFTKNLALGIFNACASYTPEVVVLGGGVGTHFSKYEKFLNEQLAEISHPMIKIPIIRGAKDAERAVINGCYELARQKA